MHIQTNSFPGSKATFPQMMVNLPKKKQQLYFKELLKFL